MTFALNHGYLFSQPFILETYHLNDKNPLIGIMMPSENFKDFLLWYTPTAYTRQTDKSEWFLAYYSPLYSEICSAII